MNRNPHDDAAYLRASRASTCPPIPDEPGKLIDRFYRRGWWFWRQGTVQAPYTCGISREPASQIYLHTSPEAAWYHAMLSPVRVP